ncbi:hypothetical protein [Lacimicrobium alkaliphilum]|nr:hypothetical protein [Lacimicrobium alkaliphilum]
MTASDFVRVKGGTSAAKGLAARHECACEQGKIAFFRRDGDKFREEFSA